MLKCERVVHLCVCARANTRACTCQRAREFIKQKHLSQHKSKHFCPSRCYIFPPVMTSGQGLGDLQFIRAQPLLNITHKSAMYVLVRPPLFMNAIADLSDRRRRLQSHLNKTHHWLISVGSGDTPVSELEERQLFVCAKWTWHWIC